MKRRSDVQILRAVAVIGIVAFHAIPERVPLGYLGVDIFFVISGCVIWPRIYSIATSNQESRAKNLRLFYFTRAMRLLPALFLTIVIFLPFVFLLGRNLDFWKSSVQALGAITILSNLTAIFTAGDYFQPFPNAFLHTWSLSLEEQIYLLLPIFSYALCRTKRRMYYGLSVAALISLIMATSLSLFNEILRHFNTPLSLIETKTTIETFVFYSPLTRFWEFYLGILASVVNRKKSLQSNHFIKNGILIGICVSYFINSENTPALNIAACILAFVFLLSQKEKKRINAISRILVWVGDRSYSLYLVHMPIAYVAKYSPIVLTQSDERKFICSLLIFPATFISGVLMYSLIENKYRMRFNEIQNSNPSMRTRKKILIFKQGSIAVGMTVGLLLANTLFLSMQDFSKRPQYAGTNQQEICKPLFSVGNVPCSLSSSDSQSTNRRIAIIGNSHAVQFLIEFKRFAEVNNLNAIYFGDLLESNELERLSEFDISAIIVSRKWTVDFSQNSKQLSLLQFLANYEGKVVLFDQVPMFPDGLRYFEDSNILQASYIEPKSFFESEMENEWLLVHESLKSQSQRFGIDFIDLKQIICKGEKCTRFVNGDWLYYDDDHLSIKGAGLVFGNVEPELILRLNSKALNTK